MPARLGVRWRRSSGISLTISEAFALSVTETGSYSSSAVCRANAQDYMQPAAAAATPGFLGSTIDSLQGSIPSSCFGPAYICRRSGRPHNTGTDVCAVAASC